MDNKTNTNVLIIGVGGTGSHAVDLLYSKIEEIGHLTNNRIRTIVFDTDEADIGKIQGATKIPLADHCTVGTAVDRLGNEQIEEWFPCWCGDEAEKRGKVDGTNYRGQDMATGANQWRKKSFLAFENLMLDSNRRRQFDQALDEFYAAGGANGLYEIFTVASIAGGTGSGSFIPITLYARKYLREKCHVEPRTHAMLACPDIYIPSLQDETQETKVYANAYAILKELNAMNQVAFGHNRARREGAKTAPIRFRLGHPDDRSVGVLFDAADEAYWDATAVPFNKIYLLDKMSGLNSVNAHDNVMASALYSLICTDIGCAFATRDNNMATAQSESDRHNAVYASIAASELVYPVESILNYMAHKKAEVSVEGDWLTIYREAEAAIADKKLQAQEAGIPYIMPNGGYAIEIENAIANERRTPTGRIGDILDRGLKTQVEVDGKMVQKDRLPDYFKGLYKNFRERLNCPEASELVGATDDKSDNFQSDLPALGLFAGGEKKRANRNDFVDRVKNFNNAITGYYRHAVEVIRNQRRSIVKNILGLGLENPMANKELSMVYNLFTIDGKYIHPVAAFALLANIKTKIRAEIKSFKAWEDITTFTNIEDLEVPAKFFELDDNETKKSHSSAYVGSDRFLKIAHDANDSYIEHNGNDPAADSKQLREDVIAIYSALFAEAHKQIIGVVLTEIEKAIDAILAEYRSFFGTFTEGKKELNQKTERLLHADEDTAEIVVVGASAAEKEATFAAYNKNEDVSEETIRELDHVTGESVFSIAYGIASAKASESLAGKADVDGLFAAIVASYKDQIRKSDFFKTMASKNVFQIVIENETKQGAPITDAIKTAGSLVSRTLDKANPSLHVAKAKEDAALLIHKSLGKYLLENAKEFYLPTNMTRGEDLVGEFLGKAGVNVNFRLADSTPAGTVYVTRKVDSIQPIDIEKLNEVGRGAVYYKNYVTAIQNMTKKDTDMWNPHLGMELHKHGYLPYINPAMEEKYNEMLAKAVLYTLLDGQITFKALPRSTQRVFWYTENGKSKIMYYKGSPVNEKRIAGIVGWLRERDELVEERSQLFDRRVRDGLRALPLLLGSTQGLTRRITEDEKIITPLRENLFAAVPGAADCKELQLGLIEFAYKVKTTEDLGDMSDCDDAEKILKAGFDALVAFCHEKIGEDDPEGRIDVYSQQLQKFLGAFIYDDDTQGFSKNSEEVVEYVKGVLDWMYKNDCFYKLTFDGKDRVSLVDLLKAPEVQAAKKEYEDRHRPIVFTETVPTDEPTEF